MVDRIYLVLCALTPLVLTFVHLTQPIVLARLGAKDLVAVSNNFALFDGLSSLVGASASLALLRTFSPKTIAAAGGLLTALSVGCYFHVGSVYSLVPPRIIMSIGTSACSVTSLALLAAFNQLWNHKEIEPPAYNLINMTTGVATGLGSALAAALAVYAYQDDTNAVLGICFKALGILVGVYSIILWYLLPTPELELSSGADLFSFAGAFFSEGGFYLITVYGPLALGQIYHKIGRCTSTECRPATVDAAAAVGLASLLGAVVAAVIHMTCRTPRKLLGAVRWACQQPTPVIGMLAAISSWKATVVRPMFMVVTMAMVNTYTGISTSTVSLSMSATNSWNLPAPIAGALGVVGVAQVSNWLMPRDLTKTFALWLALSFTGLSAFTIWHRLARDDTPPERASTGQILAFPLLVGAITIPILYCSFVQPGLLAMAGVGFASTIVPEAWLLYGGYF